MTETLDAKLERLWELQPKTPAAAVPAVGAGIVGRVTPLMEAFAPDGHLAVFREVMAAITRPGGVTERGEAVKLRRLMKTVIRPQEGNGDPSDFADRILWCAWSCLPDVDGMLSIERICSAAEAVWTWVDELLGFSLDGYEYEEEGWFAREVATEARALELSSLVTTALPSAINAAELGMRESEQLIDQLAQRTGWPRRQGSDPASPAATRHAQCGRRSAHTSDEVNAVREVGHRQAQQPLTDTDFSQSPPTRRFLVRAGDIVSIECPYATTTVTSADRSDIWVSWPWQDWRIDNDNADPVLDGLPRVPNLEYLWQPMAIRPPEAAFTASVGDHLEVGIEPSMVYVMRAYSYLPRLARKRGMVDLRHAMSVLPVGYQAIGGLAEEVSEFDPFDTPTRIALSWRAYSFLEPGQIVIDNAGQRFTFQPPLLFTDDDGQPGTPRWPLSATTQDTDSERAPQATIAETVMGCHDLMVELWEQQASIRLPDDPLLRASWFTPRP